MNRPIDRECLLAFLTDRADHPHPVVGAIYAGLADRIRRGDFDRTPPTPTHTPDPTEGATP